jgi:DNA-binding NarL/FixJ family response regulator
MTMQRTLKNEVRKAVEVEIQDRSEDPIWLSMSTIIVPSVWSELSVLVHLFRDISRQKEIERSVASLASRISGLVGMGEPHSTDRPPLPQNSGPLSERETEVLQRLACGRSTRQVAEDLFISSFTVRNHIQSIREKLQVHTRLEAVTLALRCGWIRFS